MLCRRGSPERCVFAPIRLSRPRPDSPQVLSLALREDYVSIDCVGAEAADQTHDAIEQACVVHSLEHSLIALHAALLAEMAANPTDFKVCAHPSTHARAHARTRARMHART